MNNVTLTWETPVEKSLPPALVRWPDSVLPGSGLWSSNRTAQVFHFKRATYIAIRAIAEALAENRIIVGLKDDKGKITDVGPNHPLQMLFDDPNVPDVQWQFDYLTAVYLETTGVAYWLLDDFKLGLPRSMWVLPSHWVWPKYQGGKKVAFRVYPNFGQMVEYPVDQIIEFGYPNPINPLDWMSPLFACDNWIDTAESLDYSRYAYFLQSIIPSIIMELTQPFPGSQVTDEDVQRIKAKLSERMAGPTKAGVVLALPPGVKANIVDSNREMNYIQSFDQMLDAVLAVHRVPRMLAGISKEINKANSLATREIFARYTIKPKLELLAQIKTEKLANRFYGDNVCAYYADPVPVDPDQRNKDIDLLAKNGAITLNEMRKLSPLRLEPIEGGDELLEIAGKQSEGQTDNEETDNEETETESGDGSAGKAIKNLIGRNGRFA